MNKLNEFFENEKLIVLFSLLFLVLLALPLFILGGDVPYVIRDNLDSSVIWRKILNENSMFFASSFEPVPQIMCGAPRVALGAEWNIMSLLSIIFSPVQSLAVIRLLQMLVGFTGMYLLCQRFILKNQLPLVSAVVALSFAILPFFSGGGLSIAAQPIVLFSFLRIKNNTCHIGDWGVILLYPLVSIFIVFGSFFYIFLGIIFFHNWYIKKKINWQLLFILVLSGILGIATQYREILCVFTNNDFVSIRTEFNYMGRHHYETIRSAVGYAINILFFGHHSISISNSMCIVFTIIILFLYTTVKSKKVDKRVLGLMSISVLIALWTGFIFYVPVTKIIYSTPILQMFDTSRFHVLLPLLLFMSLAYMLKNFHKNFYINLLVLMLFVFQLLFSIRHDFTYGKLLNRYVKNTHNEKTITFNEFYSVSLFENIKKHIEKAPDAYRVASLGFYPAVLSYNGFYTIDGFTNNYDVKYKHLFGNIIREELNQNPIIRNRFDFDGQFCIIYDNEVGVPTAYYRWGGASTTSLDIRYDILKQLNCQYIFSCVEIENPGENLELQQVFKNEVYEIYLYKVI